METREFLRGKITLKPALQWKSIVCEIKKLPRGARIGYDFAETLEKDATLGIIPIGYWHGYPRALSSIGRVLVKGTLSKVIGRVSMDMLTIDMSAVKKHTVGTEVILIAPNQELSASALGISRLTDSSWYETIVRLNPLIKRVFV